MLVSRREASSDGEESLTLTVRIFVGLGRLKKTMPFSRREAPKLAGTPKNILRNDPFQSLTGDLRHHSLASNLRATSRPSQPLAIHRAVRNVNRNPFDNPSWRAIFFVNGPDIRQSIVAYQMPRNLAGLLALCHHNTRVRKFIHLQIPARYLTHKDPKTTLLRARPTAPQTRSFEFVAHRPLVHDHSDIRVIKQRVRARQHMASNQL